MQSSYNVDSNVKWQPMYSGGFVKWNTTISLNNAQTPINCRNPSPAPEWLTSTGQMAGWQGRRWKSKVRFLSCIYEELFKSSYGVSLAIRRRFLLLSPYCIFVVNPRRAEGGGAFRPPRLSRIVEKQRRAAPPSFAGLFIRPFRTIPENFSPRSSLVRSSDPAS